MSEPFLIYIDRLKEGSVQKLDLHLAPDFFEIEEGELVFSDPAHIRGEVYLTDEDLILHFDASALGKMPCAACNEMASFSLAVKNFYHTQPIVEIKEMVFDLRPAVRDALLVELPRTIECGGKCPRRDALAQFLKKEPAKEESNFPFANLKLPS